MLGTLHLVKLASAATDFVRRPIQQRTLGPRGRRLIPSTVSSPARRERFVRRLSLGASSHVWTPRS